MENVFGINNRMFSFITTMMYHLSLSEQRAKINATVEYLRNMITITPSPGNNESLHEKTIRMIDESDEFNQINDFIECSRCFHKFFQNRTYYMILILGYYLCRYSLLKDKGVKSYCNADTINRIKNEQINFMQYTDEITCKDICETILEYLYDNRTEYQVKLYAAVSNNLL